MKTIADFEDFIVLYAQDASSVVLQHVLREAIIRFMRESQLFTDTVVVPVQACVQDYPIELPGCRSLVSVEAVSMAGADCVDFFDMRPTNMKFWEWHKDGRHDAIFLHQTPRKDGEMHVRYVWTIQRDDCEVPDEVYEVWMEAVKQAALAELLSMPGQEWTNQEAAMRAESFYRVELSKAKNRRWSNYSRGPMMATGRAFLRRKGF